MKRALLIGGGIFLLVAVLMGGSCVSNYNKLVNMDEAVRSQWAQVENVYQRRLDLVPNLVETVKGAASFEKETFQAVAEARSKAGQVTQQVTSDVVNDPQAMQRFQQAQEGLSSALSRLLVSVERYPELKATANFRIARSIARSRRSAPTGLRT